MAVTRIFSTKPKDYCCRGCNRLRLTGEASRRRHLESAERADRRAPFVAAALALGLVAAAVATVIWTVHAAGQA